MSDINELFGWAEHTGLFRQKLMSKAELASLPPRVLQAMVREHKRKPNEPVFYTRAWVGRHHGERRHIIGAAAICGECGDEDFGDTGM